MGIFAAPPSRNDESLLQQILVQSPLSYEKIRTLETQFVLISLKRLEHSLQKKMQLSQDRRA